MRVAFLGNMNNNHFAMARFLRDRGVDAHVLAFDYEASHFHPSADTYDLAYMSFCTVLPWGNPARWASVSDSRIERDLADYDVIVGCGLAPAYCERIGRRLDIFVPYGGDLFNFTRYRPASPNRIAALWRSVRAQRAGIRHSVIFQMDSTNPIYERLWERYRGGAERWWLGIPMVHTGTYNPETVAGMADRTHWAAEFAEIRTRSDLLLLSHARHVWGGDPNDPGQKGTDRLLEGLALFRRRNPTLRVNLMTLEYGGDVGRSKELISRLGLDDSVHWLPKMYRKDLMVGVLHADIVCAEFQNSWLSSGVIYEALAMATPILGHRDDSLYASKYPWLYPIMNARTPDEICQQLELYIADRDAHRARGEEGRRWYETHVVEAALAKYLSYIDARVPLVGRPLS